MNFKNTEKRLRVRCSNYLIDSKLMLLDSYCYGNAVRCSCCYFSKCYCTFVEIKKKTCIGQQLLSSICRIR